MNIKICVDIYVSTEPIKVMTPFLTVRNGCFHTGPATLKNFLHRPDVKSPPLVRGGTSWVQLWNNFFLHRTDVKSRNGSVVGHLGSGTGKTILHRTDVKSPEGNFLHRPDVKSPPVVCVWSVTSALVPEKLFYIRPL